MEYYKNEKLEQYRTSICGKTCAVLGVGVSNIPLIKFLLESGAKVVARDKKSLEALSENPALDITGLSAQGVMFVTGENYLENLCEDIIFKTPSMMCSKVFPSLCSITKDHFPSIS